jgi:hypothetical protein
MWKPATAVIIVTMAGATAHAQQQQSPIENLDKILVRICRNLFCRKPEVSLSAKSTSQMEEKTVFNLGRGGGDGLEINP